MINQGFFCCRKIVGLMISEVEMRVSQVLFHLFNLIISCFSCGIIVFIRFNRGHLCSCNCLILEEVGRRYGIGMINLDVSLLC